MIKRQIEKKVKELAKKYPVVLITGPRQSGKTTLAKTLFKNYHYYNLEDPVTRALIQDDPRLILSKSSEGIIIDEAQKYPELFSHIQVHVDERKERGKVILTGSENLVLSERVSQSLAGRVVGFTLLPLSVHELGSNKKIENSPNSLMINGFYPARVVENIDNNVFYTNYLSNYIERDVRQLKNVGNLNDFTRFLMMLAGHVGQQINYEAIASDLGIDRKTAMSWLSVLEASYIVFQLPPYFENFGKRLTKRSKIYFYDTGLVCHLLGIRTKSELETHFVKGALFENLVILEMLKAKFNIYIPVNFYYWRDNNAVEVDLLADYGTWMRAIEIKSSQTYKNDFIRNLNLFEKYIDKRVVQKWVVYGGENLSTTNLKICNWKDFSYTE